jgi:hypothetical protein
VPAVRQTATRQLEGGITPQTVEVVGIFVAAGNRQDASAQDVRQPACPAEERCLRGPFPGETVRSIFVADLACA